MFCLLCLLCCFVPVCFFGQYCASVLPFFHVFRLFSFSYLFAFLPSSLFDFVSFPFSFLPFQNFFFFHFSLHFLSFLNFSKLSFFKIFHFFFFCEWFPMFPFFHYFPLPPFFLYSCQFFLILSLRSTRLSLFLSFFLSFSHISCPKMYELKAQLHSAQILTLTVSRSRMVIYLVWFSELLRDNVTCYIPPIALHDL